MKKILLCLFGILLVIVENSITNHIDIFGVSCSLVLIYIPIIALYLDELEVGITGAIAGLIKDITIGGVLGVNALTLFIIGYGISYLRDKLYKDSYITVFALVFISSLFDSMVNILVSSFVFNNYSIKTLMIKGILLIPIVNSILSIGIYKASRKSVLKLKED